MDKKIVLLDGTYANPGDLSWESLKKFGQVAYFDDTDHEDKYLIVERIGEAEIVITNKVALDGQIISQLPNLKLIVVSATGVNNIDLETASDHGIKVANVPSYSTESVAQHVFALLLEATNKVGSHAKRVEDGEWSDKGQWTFYETPLIELAGKTIGVIGFGEIGQRVGQIAKAFGMDVLAYNRSQSEKGRQIGTYVDWDDLLAQSDVISLHLPLTEKTEKIIDEDALSKLKKYAILVNTARGPLVDEPTIVQALDDERLYFYASDVSTIEPIEKDNPLLGHPKAIVTPHIAWASQESRGRLIDIITENVQSYIDGNPQNIVNQ